MYLHHEALDQSIGLHYDPRSKQTLIHASNILRPSVKPTAALAQRIPRNQWVKPRKKRRKEEKGVPRPLHTSFSFSQAPNTYGSPENIPLVAGEEGEEVGNKIPQ